MDQDQGDKEKRGRGAGTVDSKGSGHDGSLVQDPLSGYCLSRDPPPQAALDFCTAGDDLELLLLCPYPECQD